MAEYNFNLRGMLIVPTDKDQIQFYLCALDVPAGLSAGDFTQVKSDDTTVCAYKCSKDFSQFTGAATQTINLPMYTYTPYVTKTSILIKDNTEANICKGDPNTGRPPVIKLQANPGSGYMTTNLVVQSATPGFENNYFLVVIASTKDEEQNYSNAFQSMVPNDENSVVCTPAYEGGRGAVAIIGVIPAPTQYATSQVGGGPTSAINWGQSYKI